MRIGFLGDENLSGYGLALETRSYIDRIAEHGVVRYLATANVADKRFPRGDADAYAQAVYRRGCHVLAHDFAGGRHRSLGVIAATNRRAEKAHDLIADEFVQSAVMAKNRFGRQLVKAIELGGYIRGLELLGERRKAADIDEYDRKDASLPARRSQLVSKRAKIGIFP